MMKALTPLVLVALALAACASPYRDRPIASAPTKRAQTSQIDDHFTFGWSEFGRPREQWANYGR